jgi:hypothetical protein
MIWLLAPGRVIYCKQKKSETRKRKPRRIKDHNREPKGNFDELLAKFTYKSLVGPIFEN